MEKFFQAAAVLLLGCSLGVAQTQDLDQQLQRELNRFLADYGRFNRYADTTPSAVEAKLSDDRRRVFHATIRALFTEITPTNASQAQGRVIDFLEHVRGIWGLRMGNREGKHQFRMSVVWDKGLWKLLQQSDNLPESVNGHVLLPGGDDNPHFKGFLVIDGRRVKTHRQSGLPSLQLSYLIEDERTGEVDIDFDHWLSRCHGRPSNSDPGARSGNHSHLGDFNLVYNFFSHPLKVVEDTRNHCERAYSDGAQN